MNLDSWSINLLKFSNYKQVRSSGTFTVDSIAGVSLITSTCKATNYIFTVGSCMAVVASIEAFIYIWRNKERIVIISLGEDLDFTLNVRIRSRLYKQIVLYLYSWLHHRCSLGCKYIKSYHQYFCRVHLRGSCRLYLDIHLHLEIT